MERAVLREDMVDGLIHESRGVLDHEAVEAAMLEVPRHQFVEDEQRAYADATQRSHGTRILAPSTVAAIVQELDPTPGDSVLVIGAGVGYTAAIIAEIVGATNVHAVDIARPVVYEARRNLARAGYGQVLVDCRDGARGLPEYGPFDRILLEAAAVSPPDALQAQLTTGGQLVYPEVGSPQQLVRLTAAGDRHKGKAVSFEPLLVPGEQAGALERNRTSREDDEYARRRLESRGGWEHEWISWDDSVRTRSR
ncbi:MAG: protein-L-isoaspartate O-methyltransferase [Natrialbaceae archaeon]|nr:protein-L-isoaspartate O-methyltransferase [Natrialbaceae archaeon]